MKLDSFPANDHAVPSSSFLAMKTWTPLTPSRPGDSLSSLLKATNLTSSSHSHPIRLRPPQQLGAWIGPLPESLHLLIIASLPVADLPRLARVSRAFGRLVVSDEAWEGRCKSLGLKESESKETKEGELASFLLPLLLPQVSEQYIETRLETLRLLSSSIHAPKSSQALC